MQAIVLAVPITAHVPAVVASRPSTCLISMASISPARNLAQKRRQSVQAPRRSPLWRPGHHRARHELDRRTAGRRRAHQLRGHGLVAAADQHHRIHRLGADHLLHVHRHQVAEHHAGRVEEHLAQRDGRELARQAAGGQHAARHRLGELGHVAMAVVELARRDGDADDRLVQQLVGHAHRARHRAAQVAREVAIAVVREPAIQALSFGRHVGLRVVECPLSGSCPAVRDRGSVAILSAVTSHDPARKGHREARRGRLVYRGRSRPSHRSHWKDPVRLRA